MNLETLRKVLLAMEEQGVAENVQEDLRSILALADRDEERCARARQQAEAQAEAEAQAASIARRVAALECDYDRLEELREERADSAFASRVLAEKKGLPVVASGDWWEDMNPGEAEELADLEEAADGCEDADKARQRVEEDPLSVQVRSAWGAPGDTLEPAEFGLLLCTGGPAVRIRGELDQYRQPDRARIEYQDWGTPWTEYHGDAVSAADLLTYCQQFYFGE